MTEFSTEVIEYDNRSGVKWTIKEDDIKRAFALDEDFASDTFKASNIPGAKYFISLESSRDKHVSIFLKSSFGTIRKVPASYKISIKSASYNDEMDYGGFEEYGGCGNIICTSKEKLFDPESKFFVDGIMVVELEITVKTHGIKRKAAKPLSLAHAAEAAKKFNGYEISPGKTLKVNVSVANTRLFIGNIPKYKTKNEILDELKKHAAALESGMKEAIEKKITFTDFSYETVKIAIEHCYEREVDDLINDENASKLLHFADKYKIQPLHMQNVELKRKKIRPWNCEKLVVEWADQIDEPDDEMMSKKLLQIYFIDKLSESNVVNFANLSIKTNAEELRDVCVSFLMKYIGKNTKIEDVKNLDKEISSDVGQRSLLYMSSEYEYFTSF
uniref:Uncharacterized protein n=1 Tax=Panagrolaimus sp. PS1159 TaxID=55785 RepID=A0AC35GW48_9BILA